MRATQERTIQLPPHSLEAEMGVLGAILVDRAAFPRATEIITPVDFYQERHRLIFRVMTALHEVGGGLDLVAVAEYLKRTGDLEKAGGASYLTELASGTPTAANVQYHARIVREEGVRRCIWQACVNITQNIESEELPDLINRLEVVKGLSLVSAEGQFIGAVDVLSEGDQEQYLVDGIIPIGALVLIAGPQGSYKTLFALSLAHAVSEGAPFLGKQTAQTLVYVIDRENIRVTHRNYYNLLGIGADSNINLWPMWAEQEPPAFPNPAYTALKDSLIVFDSLVRFFPKGADENASMDVSPVMGFLRGLAKQGNTVIVLHHVAKASDSDYRGSTDISAAVDVALRIHRHGEGSRSLMLRCFKSRFYEEFELPVEVIHHTGGGLSFDTAPDRDVEDIEALYDLMKGRNLNQTQVYDLAREKLGLKNKGRLIHLLKEGEGRYWQRTREGKRVLYSPNSTVLLSAPLEGQDSWTVHGVCSQGHETGGGGKNEKVLKKQQLSYCPGGAETVKTVQPESGNGGPRCQDAQKCSQGRDGSCSQAAALREKCGGPF